MSCDLRKFSHPWIQVVLTYDACPTSLTTERRRSMAQDGKPLVKVGNDTPLVTGSAVSRVSSVWLVVSTVYCVCLRVTLFFPTHTHRYS